MNTIEKKFRTAAEDAINRVDFDKICNTLTNDLIDNYLQVHRIGKTFGEDSISFNVQAYLPGVGDDLEKIIEAGTLIKKYYCFAGESEDTIEEPSLEDFFSQIMNAVAEWSFELF